MKTMGMIAGFASLLCGGIFLADAPGWAVAVALSWFFGTWSENLLKESNKSAGDGGVT